MGRVLRLLPGVDYKRLPLTPAEGNVFSRIDGARPEEEIVRLTGYHADTVGRALDRLVELGAAEDLAVVAAREAQEREAIVVDRLAFGGLDPKAPPIYDAKELDEDGDLEPAKKKQVLDAFYRLDRLSYYELLGVHQLADKKQIKAAYYQIAPDFHPDKYFRKNLGFFRSKIEAVFARLSIAHETLTHREKRAEYDDYLATIEQTRSADQILGSTQRAIAEAQAAIEQRARQAASNEDPRAQAILAERRKALAAKLSGGLGRPGQKRDAAQPAVDPKAAAEALRVRYEMARQEAQKAQIQRYIESGRDAAEQGSWAAAANAYRIAASLSPNDEQLKREAAEIQQQAAAKLADGFMKQGEYEAAQERWVEAAISYSKACQGKPDDAKAHDKAAHATFRARNNPRRALELAKRAVELGPDQVMFRVTLAYCFMAAGMDQSAFAELERASKGAKDNEVLKRAIDHAHEALAKGRYAPQESLFERDAKDRKVGRSSLAPGSLRQGPPPPAAPPPRMTAPPNTEPTSVAVSHDAFSVAQGVQTFINPAKYPSPQPAMRESSPGLTPLPAFGPPPGPDSSGAPWPSGQSFNPHHQAIHPPPQSMGGPPSVEAGHEGWAGYNGGHAAYPHPAQAPYGAPSGEYAAYPTSSQASYPTSSQAGYAPSSQASYPTSSQAGYAPSSQAGYAPSSQVGPAGYASGPYPAQPYPGAPHVSGQYPYAQPYQGAPPHPAMVPSPPPSAPYSPPASSSPYGSTPPPYDPRGTNPQGGDPYAGVSPTPGQAPSAPPSAPSQPPASPSMAPLSNPVPGRWGSSAPKAGENAGRYSLSQPPGPPKPRR